MQRKIKLKPFVIPTIYGIITISMVISLLLIGAKLLKKETKVSYITSSTIIEDIKPVVSEAKVIKRPYKEEDIKILKNFYENDSEKETQQNSLIFYENTYLQNSGIDYGREKVFDVYSIYSGTVIDIKEDDILGKIIEIQHSNNIIATYQCIDNIKVNKNDVIAEGQIIATSGTCNISKNLGNHLHLEVSNNGQMINPETIYGKNINEL